MSKVCGRLSRFSLYHNVFSNRRHVNLRMLSVTSQCHAKSRKPPDDEEDKESKSQPIKFSTSKASHRVWTVNYSMGSNHQRPWLKVLPVSLLGAGFLIWCVFRRQTDLDESLDKSLYEHLPEVLSDEEEEKKNGDANKAS